MRILVTGAAGFIGSRTVKLLVENGHTVSCVDNLSSGRLDNIDNWQIDQKKLSIYEVDIEDEVSLSKVFQKAKPEAVLHLAAQSAITTSMRNPHGDLRTNAEGTLKVLVESKFAGVKRFVFSSTSAVYDENHFEFSGLRESSPCNPTTPYGISKLAAEHYIRTMFPNHCIFRYANVYGINQRPVGENQVIARAMRHFKYRDDFQIFGDGKQKRDFIFSEDVAMANMRALTSGLTGTYNLATGRSYSVNEVLAKIETILRIKNYDWKHAPTPDPRGDVYINNKKFKNVFGMKKFTTLDDGLRQTAEWWSLA